MSGRINYHTRFNMIDEFLSNRIRTRGTPKPVVDRLNAVIRTITEQPDMRALFAQEAAGPVALTPSEFSAYYKNEIARWRKVARERNLAATN